MTLAPRPNHRESLMKKATAALLATTFIASGAVLPRFAMAAEEPSISESTDIVVTARRVEERLQDVPISMTVFSQETLDNQNVFSSKDLATYTPSLSANTRYGSDLASFAIRGFSQDARTTASVGVYFADAVVPRSSPLSAAGDGAGPGNLFDLQSVQVLKGPQGTLFGRNTTGGAVVLVPKRPTDNLEGYVEGSVGNYDMRRVQAVLNAPLADTFRVRLGVDRQKRDGYLRNISGIGPEKLADVDYTAARLSVVGDLTPDLENYLVVMYAKSDNSGSSPKVTDCYTRENILSGPYGYACQQIARERDAGDLAVTNWLPFTHQRVETWQIINALKWQASDYLTVKNINSYGQVKQHQAIDMNGLFVPLGDTLQMPSNSPPYYANVGVPAQYQGLWFGHDTSIAPPGLNTGDQETFTQELQFQGTVPSNDLTWQAGIYFERSAPLGFSGSQAMNSAICSDYDEYANWACADAAAVTGSSRALGSRNLNIGTVNYRNIAVYAQGTYEVTPTLSIDAGIRYTWDKSWGSSRTLLASYSAATRWNTPTFQCTDPSLTYVSGSADCHQEYKQTSSAPTWIVGLNYKPVEDVMLYAKYSRGYRQGSISPIAALGFKSYEPETVDVYEIGSKTTWHGAAPGYFNISAFYNDFRDMQLQVSFQDLNNVSPNLSPLPAVVNAGKSTIYGVEAEFGIRPFEGFALTASYGYIHTELNSIQDPDLSQQPPGFYDTIGSKPVAGSRLTGTPDHKVAITANYSLPLPEAVGRVTIGGAYVYTGSIFHGYGAQVPRVDSIFSPDDKASDVSTAPGYSLMNFNVNWERIAGSNLDANFFITNAFDKRHFESRTLSASRGYTARYYGEPRMYGMKLRYSF